MIQRVIFVTLLFLTYIRLTAEFQNPIERWDEYTNVSVIQESIASETFPTLVYEGKPFFEKPPLWFFLHISIGKIFNSHIPTIRTTSILFALVSIFLTVYLSWKQYGAVAAFSTWGIILAANQLFEKNSGGYFSTHTLTSADPDGLFILFVIVQSMLLIQKLIKKYSLVLGLVCGLTVLTKGPLGFAPILTALYIYKKDAFMLRTLMRTCLVACAVIIPWFAYMYVSFGKDFLTEHIGYHLIARSLYGLEDHGGSWLFYIQLVSNLYVFPGFILCLCVYFWIIKNFENQPKDIQYFTLLSLLFIAIPTLVQTKLAWYILPAYPYLAYVTGYGIAALSNTKKNY